MAILDQDTQLMFPSDDFYSTVFAKFDANKDKRLDAVEVCVIVSSEWHWLAVSRLCYVQLLAAMRAVMSERCASLPHDCLAYALVVLDVVSLHSLAQVDFVSSTTQQVVLSPVNTWELALHEFTFSMFLNVCAVVVRLAGESAPVIACAAGLDLQTSYTVLNALKVQLAVHCCDMSCWCASHRVDSVSWAARTSWQSDRKKSSCSFLAFVQLRVL
jgi:hypothetical protein